MQRINHSTPRHSAYFKCYIHPSVYPVRDKYAKHAFNAQK